MATAAHVTQQATFLEGRTPAGARTHELLKGNLVLKRQRPTDMQDHLDLLSWISGMLLTRRSGQCKVLRQTAAIRLGRQDALRFFVEARWSPRAQKQVGGYQDLCIQTYAGRCRRVHILHTHSTSSLNP